MAILVHFSAQVHDSLKDTDLHMEQIDRLMVIERLFNRPLNLLISLLNQVSTTGQQDACCP
jgi:hypothetical protein